MEDTTVHDVIGSMSDFERGWYHALITTLWWSERHKSRLPLDWDEKEEKYLITTYSPSGSNQPAPSFYEEGKKADDAISYYFDPKKFEAAWRELDYEAAICYYRLFNVIQHYANTNFTTRELVIQVRSTEDEHGLPSDWDSYPTDFPTPINRVIPSK